MKRQLALLISILFLSGCLGKNASNSTPIVNANGLSGFGEITIGSTYDEIIPKLHWTYIGSQDSPDTKKIQGKYLLANEIDAEMSLTFYKDSLIRIQFSSFSKNDVKEALKLKYGDGKEYGYATKRMESYTWVGEIATAEYLRNDAYNVETMEIYPTNRNVLEEMSQQEQRLKEQQKIERENKLKEAL